MPTIVVTAFAPHLQSFADAIAQKLNISCATDAAGADWILELRPVDAPDNYRLELRHAGPNSPGGIFVDFVGGRAGHRRRTGEGRKQPLGRAVGLKPGEHPRILDATGGLGRDAFVLATLGCFVTVIERNAFVCALLEDGLRRAAHDPETAAVVSRITLMHEDARSYLADLPDNACPDVIYLDPMYPTREKSAAVKKEMRMLQELLGPDSDADQLLTFARKCARQRVVVKRPKSAPDLNGETPHHRIVTPNTRYDVYTG